MFIYFPNNILLTDCITEEINCVQLLIFITATDLIEMLMEPQKNVHKKYIHKYGEENEVHSNS